MSVCHSKFIQMVSPVLLTLLATLIVFVGGVTRIYHTDVRIAIALMVVLFNVATFLLFGLDKCCAKKNSRTRIAELVLYYMTFFGSPIGALLGMLCFRHKTAKREFLCYIIPLFIFNFFWVFVYFIATARKSLSSAFK